MAWNVFYFSYATLLQFFQFYDILLHMENKYLMVLSAFIQKEKCERILFELKSTKKRETAFSKMSNFSQYFNTKDISIDLSHLEVENAIKIIQRSVSSTNCFDLAYNEVCSICKAYERNKRASESIIKDLPAPVSPVKTLNPFPSSIVNSSINAIFFIVKL